VDFIFFYSNNNNIKLNALNNKNDLPMLNNYTVKQPKLPLNKNIKKPLKNQTLTNILNFSKSFQVLKGKKENFELMLN